MTRTMIAGIVAVAMTLGSLTPAAAQQQQNNENLARLLAGAAGLFIIGKAISDRNDNRRERRADARAEELLLSRQREELAAAERRRERERLERRDRYRYVEPDYYRDRRYDRCWREKWRGGKIVRYRDGKCMKAMNKRHKRWKHDRRYVERPRECLRKRWTRDGWVTYWSQRCLDRHGWDGRHTRYRD